jgi:PPOX class probable F420-dependent enzyme
MSENIPAEIQGKNYISLATFRKNGSAVYTPVWFAEKDGKLFVMTRTDSGKFKRIRNNPEVKIAACTMSGKITGPEFAARVRILPESDWGTARNAIRAKYWLARVPFVWSKTNAYLEITV